MIGLYRAGDGVASAAGRERSAQYSAYASTQGGHPRIALAQVSFMLGAARTSIWMASQMADWRCDLDSSHILFTMSQAERVLSWEPGGKSGAHS